MAFRESEKRNQNQSPVNDLFVYQLNTVCVKNYEQQSCIRFGDVEQTLATGQQLKKPKTDEQINVVGEVEQQLVTGQHVDSALPSPRFTNQASVKLINTASA